MAHGQAWRLSPTFHLMFILDLHPLGIYATPIL